MNGRQRLVLVVGLGLVLASALVPPWRGYIYSDRTRLELGSRGYKPVWSPALEGRIVSEVDYSRLLMQWLLIMLLVGGGVLLLRIKPDSTRIDTQTNKHKAFNPAAGTVNSAPSSDDSTNDQKSPEYKAAIYCFIAAEKSIEQLAVLDNLSVKAYFTAITEIVCCAMHLADRTLFVSAPENRDARMESLVTECLEIVPQGLYSNVLTETEKAEIKSHAQGMFLETYQERSIEYATLTDDSLKRVMFRGGQHVAEALSESAPSYEDTMKANIQIVVVHTAMMEAVPEFFKACLGEESGLPARA